MIDSRQEYGPRALIKQSDKVMVGKRQMQPQFKHNSSLFQRHPSVVGTIKSLPNLQELSWSVSVPVNTVEGCDYSSLTKLVLSYNKLRIFPEALPCLAPNLQELDISDNEFKHVDIQFIPQSIKKFTARRCKIARFGNVLQKDMWSQVVRNCRHGKTFGMPCQHRSHRNLPCLLNLDLLGNDLSHFQLIHHPPLESEREDPSKEDRQYRHGVASHDLLYPLLEGLDLGRNKLEGQFNPNICYQSHLKSINLSENHSLEKLSMEFAHLKNSRLFTELLQSRAAMTAFSQACKEGHQDLAVALITDLVCLSPLSADSDGNTLLHIAAIHGQERCVALLLNAYNAPVYVRNNAGKTAREITRFSCIRVIFDNYLKENAGTIQDIYKHLQLLSTNKYSGEQRLTRVFVVGNILSGKSTLIESLKREGFFASFGQVSENTVPLHTSGIIPSVHDSKTIGRILYYDFAGDPEYYSSHSAIISNVIRSKVGSNVFLIVLSFNKDISKIQEELGYWLCFISYHSKCASESKCTVTVMTIGSHVDLITNAEMNRKLKGISKFTHTHFSQILPTPGNFEFYKDTLTLNCRQPRLAQGVRDAIFQISKGTQPFSLSPEATILLGLLEKDFKNVVTCNIQGLLAHITDTDICLPTTVENLYPVLEQLHDVGLLMIIGRHSDKLEDHIVLLNISKVTNEVHKLLFSSPTVDDDPNVHARLSMGVLPQSYLNDILPKYITSDCLIQLQYCHSFDHFEVKLDYVTPANHEHNDSTLFYFPALCKSERKESIVTPDGFNYHIGYFAECEVKLQYFPPRFLHLLFLRLAYSYALQAAKENTITSDVEAVALLHRYNRRCTMWKNGIHWLMQEGIECFIESVNNSKAIVVITKSKEEQKSTCSEVLFKILREFQQVKDEVCENVALQQYILDSDNPSSCSDRYKLFEMSQIEQVLRERKCSIVSVNGKGHLDAEKIVHFMKCILWGEYYDIKINANP